MVFGEEEGGGRPPGQARAPVLPEMDLACEFETPAAEFVVFFFEGDAALSEGEVVVEGGHALKLEKLDGAEAFLIEVQVDLSLHSFPGAGTELDRVSIADGGPEFGCDGGVGGACFANLLPAVVIPVNFVAADPEAEALGGGGGNHFLEVVVGMAFFEPGEKLVALLFGEGGEFGDGALFSHRFGLVKG